jgi:hypothetical protein
MDTTNDLPNVSEVAAMGGKARAKSLTPEQRQEIARRAVQARWEKAGKVPAVAQATHGSPDRPLRIGDTEIPCYVLADGRRVLAQSGLIRALGMSYGGSYSRGGDRLAKFTSQGRLKSFVSRELTDRTAEPIRFRTPGGNEAYGYEATVLADICDAILEARKAGILQKQQVHIAAQAEVLVRGFARVGIIALVDEATGYQADRSRDALAKILEAFIAKELRPWARAFQPDFYEELFRLRNIPFNGNLKQPRYIGHLINDIVYKRLAPGVLEELRRLNPTNDKGQRRAKHFQWLSEHVGFQKLSQHLAAATALMRVAPNGDYEGFKKMLDKALPIQVACPLFDPPSEEPMKSLQAVEEPERD